MRALATILSLEAKNMNLVLITIDCLRADHLSCIGYKKNTTPFIDQLAKKGALYTNVIANGLGTGTAFPAVMTSTYPHMSIPYKTSKKTIAEVLRERGYKTAGFNDNPFLSSYFGYNRGFDFFEDFIGEAKAETGAIRGIKKKMKEMVSVDEKLRSFAQFFLRMFSSLGLQPSGDGLTINRKVFSWLEENYKYSFFLWIHYMDVHGPHRAPKDYIQKVNGWCPSIIGRRKLAAFTGNKSLDKRETDILKAIYDAEIRYVDDRVRELFRNLTSLGIAKDTNLIITADHGEEFFEHGGYHCAQAPNFYDEMIRIPLIIYGPNISSKRIESQVEHIDIAPTILAVLGEPKENRFTGKNLLANARSECVITECARGHARMILSFKDFDLLKISIRLEEDGEKWKYILSIREMKEELYNLSMDPFEKKNVVKEAGKMLKKLRKKAMKHTKKAMIWKKKLKKLEQTYTTEEKEQIKERLRSLGYL